MSRAPRHSGEASDGPASGRGAATKPQTAELQRARTAPSTEHGPERWICC